MIFANTSLMKIKVLLVLMIVLLCQSCSGQPNVANPVASKKITIWTKTIEQFVAYRGSLYKLDRVFNDGMEYVRGEWSANGTYIKAIDYNTKQEIWKNQIQVDSITNFVFDDTRILFGTSLGMYYALNKKTGKELWSYKAPLAIYNFNNIHKKSVIFTDVSEKVYCLNSETGALLWTFDLSSLFTTDIALQSGPTYSSGIIFYALNQGILLGIDANTGLEKWRTEYPYGKDDPFYLQNDMILTWGTIENQIINFQTFLLQTGQRTWSQKIQKNTDEKAVIMPIFINKLVIINDNFAALHCFNAKTGVVIRRIDLRPMHYVVDPNKNFWTVDKNILYFLGKDEANTEEMIYALDLSGGRVSWKKALGKQEKVKIRLAGQYFFVTLQNKLLILNKKNGNELKNIEMPYEFEISEILKDIVIVCPIGQTVSPEEYAVALRWK